MKALICWIGKTDLDASEGIGSAGIGPIAQALAWRNFDLVMLLSDWSKAKTAKYRDWLVRRSSSGKIETRQCPLTGPTQFGEIHEAVVRETSDLLNKHGNDVDLTFHLSPGTPSMAAVWILLAKTRFPAELIESSKEHGVRVARVPFDISAEFIPDLTRRSDQKLERLAQGKPEEAPAFADILCRSPQMRQVISRARRIAIRNIPVLIEGESGTGKELFARAIHGAGLRAGKPLIAVNCGAIPTELVESEFFGHKKSAFSGATADRAGHFEEAHGGTLFLDEVGELPLAVQVKLLRVLQQGEVVRIGESAARKVDVRIIAATNRTLIKEVAAGRFREDLFFRLAVAILKLPPLRERSGDLTLLIDQFLEEINREMQGDPNHLDKKLSAGAKNVMQRHAWPGNVRELRNTLQRVMVWSEEESISAESMKDAILDLGSISGHKDAILNRPIEEGVDLIALLDEVKRHYLSRAHVATRGNLAQMTKLLGFKNYQTVGSWLEKCGIPK